MSIFHTAVQKVEQHPYIAAGGVFAVGLVLVLVLASGSKGTAAATTTVASSTAGDATTAAEIQSANALQTTQLQYQAAVQQTAAQASVASAQVAGQVQIATLQAGVQSDTVAAQLAGLKDQDSTSVLLGNQTLDATNKQTAASLALGLGQIATQQLQINDTANTQQQGQQLAAQTSQLQITSAAATLQQQIAASAQTSQFQAAQTSYQVAATAAAGVQNNYNTAAVAIAALGGGKYLSSPAQGGWAS